MTWTQAQILSTNSESEVKVKHYEDEVSISGLISLNVPVTLIFHGIDNLIGLNLFHDGMPADSKNQCFKAILEPCDDLGLDKIKERIENDRYYLLVSDADLIYQYNR